MKYVIASDIHGSAFWCDKLLKAVQAENADKLLLLGDLLYHGPRNPFPQDYACPNVSAALNAVKDKIVCVRGNCDSEVDQMVLEFPIRADYALVDGGQNRTLFLTHGHLFNEQTPPVLNAGDMLLNGHFHFPRYAVMENGALYANCGSIALPKDGSPHSYIVYENGTLSWKDLETGKVFDFIDLNA